MKWKLLITTTLLTLAACTSQPSKTLDQKLAEATTTAERKETLRLACLNEAEWPIYNSRTYARANSKVKTRMKNRFTPEVSEMKTLCRQMDELTDSKTEEKQSPKALAVKCAEAVATKKKGDRNGSAEHASRIKAICEKMTGYKVK